MKRCNKCNIEINTSLKYCPLCHQELSGDVPNDFVELYPKKQSLRKTVMPAFKKSILMMTLISTILLGLINYLSFDGTYWAVIPVIAIIYFWLLLRVGIFSKTNITFKLMVLSVLLILLLIGVDFYSVPENNGWSLDYLMPFLLVASNITISLIIWIKNINYHDYIFSLLVIIIFSLTPIILVKLNIITILWPSIVSLGLALFILLILIFFLPDWLKDEIKKRFHA